MPHQVEQLQAYIRRAVFAEHLHAVAVTAANGDLNPVDRYRLQQLFWSRCRELWPTAYRGGGNGRRGRSGNRRQQK